MKLLKPDENGNIDFPDELMPLFDKVGMQMRFCTISGKNESLTVAHICQISQKFFSEHPNLLTDQL